MPSEMIAAILVTSPYFAASPLARLVAHSWRPGSPFSFPLLRAKTEVHTAYTSFPDPCPAGPGYGSLYGVLDINIFPTINVRGIPNLKHETNWIGLIMYNSDSTYILDLYVRKLTFIATFFRFKLPLLAIFWVYNCRANLPQPAALQNCRNNPVASVAWSTYDRQTKVMVYFLERSRRGDAFPGSVTYRGFCEVEWTPHKQCNINEELAEWTIWSGGSQVPGSEPNAAFGMSSGRDLDPHLALLIPIFSVLVRDVFDGYSGHSII
ncbi:hypothetical protein GGX14DRAFT_400572 [Mycena pura]|uniref:Uncharacterized protein n=1 Tax=Mycena pura TaxID=153505 RepID=A0AAD6V4G4_9AGAR|nr:hypothetical protein GGX14DRAFT_400572 [Mycena pura]